MLKFIEKSWQAMRNKIGGVRRDKSGSVAIIVAFTMPVLLGAMALTLDVSYWRYRQTVLQSAADASTVSALYDLTQIAKLANNGVLPDNNTTYPIYYKGNTFTSVASVKQFIANTASFESKKNCTDGSGYSCSPGTITWPYNGSYSQIQVNTKDNGARQYFSGIVGSFTKAMAGTSAGTVAATATTGGTVTTAQVDDGCLMALNGSVTFWNANAGVNAPCTVIADNGNIVLYGGPNLWIKGTAYTTGTVSVTNDPNGGVGGQILQYQTPVADPYASASMFPTAIRNDNGTLFPAQSANASSLPCNDSFAGNMYTTQLSANGVGQHQVAVPSPYSWTNSQDAYYNSDYTGTVINQLHPWHGFTWNATKNRWEITGGARLCMGLISDSGTIYFGPGIYFIEYAGNLSNTTIIVDHATLVIGNMSGGNYNWNGLTIHAAAPAQGTAFPTFGPYGSNDLSRGIAGIWLTTLPNGLNQLGAASNSEWDFSGDIYMPTFNWNTVQAGIVLQGGSFDSNMNLTATGSTTCGRIIVANFYSGAGANIGNNCSYALGVQPFGAGSANAAAGAGGWAVTVTSGGPSQTKTTTNSYPKIVQ